METTGVSAERRAGLEGLHGWGWAAGLGIALLVLGTVALVATSMFTLGSVLALGVIMMVAGLVQAAHAFRAHRWQGVLLHVAAGLLYIVVGAMMVGYPLMGAMTLTLLFAAFFVVAGAFRLAAALILRFQHWGWAAVSGGVSLALGIIVWAQWPASSLWLIGTLLGIDLLFNGWSWLVLGLGLRHLRQPSHA